ncbi:MAG: imidazoleglycerol-phosphate dehydratase HisB [Clostridium baratii]|uniref:imidazoleglycerol-phosphate dehydratase HisB n=1 Tax=Clostridium baratii TaxID=1561 RepID=UPI00242FC572|nr:imidazoleglycerol-phosphate dehydratase HisB [Clostridium baratii]MBS6041729.1 imidazoleglycerol-phosphate dehydratase HisB [Clostridium baratii]
MREAVINRETKETKINLKLNIDGSGKSHINTGIGFFDHMLTLLAFHSNMDLMIDCSGDTWVCDHHTVEDVGIVLGKAFNKALGDMKGIERYGSFYIPMDESLAFVSLDISGRPFLVFDGQFTRDNIGGFSTEMTEEFFRSFAFNAMIALHGKVLYGKNDHHKIEGLFKALGRAIKCAKAINGNELPSTKGVL